MNNQKNLGKRKIGSALLSLLLVLGFVIVVFPPITTTQAAVDANSFSIMQISDLQHLAFLSPTLYNDTTSWIVNNSTNYNLKMVIDTGDFVDAFKAPPLTLYNSTQIAQEWAIANAAMSKLLASGIPYCWCAGNHDQTPFNSPNGTMIGSTYPSFNTTTMRAKSYWVDDIYDAKSTAVKFTYNNYSFMIIDLESFANTSAISWMKNLLDRNIGVNTIVATHGYLDGNANYDTSTATASAWTKNLKLTLDSYPQVFLALSGHNHGWNMTRSGNRQEILFDFQEENNLTGAAAVRIYSFNLTNKKVSASTYCIDNKTWLTDAYNQFTFDASLVSDWTLVTDARAMKAHPDLREYVWQKDAIMPPNGQYDKIALHRLVKSGTTTKGVIFICPRAGWSGEAWISNPPTDNYTRTENNSQPIYWANRGFDVYAIDYRTHFVPSNLTNSQLAFMQNWTYNQWVSDIKEAVEKTKEVSGAKKVFLIGPSNGGGYAVCYASKYWQEDLRGIVLLDALILSGNTPIVAKNATGTNTNNLTKAINDMIASATWSTANVAIPGRLKYSIENPGSPAEYPIGTPLTPTINPVTNKPWANITEWNTYNFQMAGSSNLYEGYGNVTEVMIQLLAADPYFPKRITLEGQAMADWTNCPYVGYDFDDHFKEINVPVLAFATGPLYSNKTGTFLFVNGMATSDFTGIMLQKYGHADVYTGTYSARDVSQPTLDWMLSHYQPPSASAFCSVTVTTGQTWYFFAHSASSAAPNIYQWYEGTTMLTGQTSMLLQVTKATAGTYTYSCKVTDAEGTTATSNTITLTVINK